MKTGRKQMLLMRIFARDMYLVWLVFMRWVATGLGLGVGIFFAAVILKVVREVVS